MVTKFKHHMRLNFLNSVCALWTEKKHSLLQLRHQASCQPINQSPCACWLSHSFVQHHIAFSRKWLKRLSGENARKGKAKMVTKVSEPINHRNYHIIMYQNGTTLSCTIQYIGFRSSSTSWSKLQVVFSLLIKQTYPVHCLVWCILCINHLSLKCLFRQRAW